MYEDELVDVPLSADLGSVEVRYRELYTNAKKQMDILLVELRNLRTSQPHLLATINMIEQYLVDFEKLASAQRIVPVDR